MADTETFKQHSFSTENDQVEGYRRLSRLAVWSIPLGLLSSLSLVSPLLWFLPVVAVAFALGGLWQIARSNDMTGRRLALTGMGLAILFGTWGMTWTISRQMVINRQSREHASEWLALMQQGEYMKAHQLGRNFFERLPSGSSLEEHYAEREPERSDADESSQASLPRPPAGMSPGSETPPSEQLKDFKNNGIPKILVAANGKFDFEFVKNETHQRDGQFAIRVEQVFRVMFSEDHQPRAMDVKIEMKRTVDARKAHWQVGPLTEVSKSS